MGLAISNSSVLRCRNTPCRAFSVPLTCKFIRLFLLKRVSYCPFSPQVVSYINSTIGCANRPIKSNKTAVGSAVRANNNNNKRVRHRMPDTHNTNKNSRSTLNTGVRVCVCVCDLVLCACKEFKKCLLQLDKNFL